MKFYFPSSALALLVFGVSSALAEEESKYAGNMASLGDSFAAGIGANITL